MSRPIEHDRNMLHAQMWVRAGRRHVFTASLKDLSKDLDISYFHLTRIVKNFVEEGRLRVLGRGQNRLQTLQVIDPIYWNVERGDLEGANLAKTTIDSFQPKHKGRR